MLIILGAALILGTLAEQLRQSAILGYLIAGTLVGPNVLGFVDQIDHVRAIAELGVALLLFTIGLEFSFRRLMLLGRVALLGGTLQVVTTLAIGAGIAAVSGLSWQASLAVGAIVALSSTACVLRLLTERAAIDSVYGRNALGILLLQDVAVIPMMILVVILAGGSTLSEAVWMLSRTVLLGGLLVAGFLILFNLIVPHLLSLQQWSRNREFPVLLAIVLALGSAYAAHAASLSPAMGAFVAGVLLGGTPFAAQVRSDVGSLRTVLVTLFFATIGMLSNPAWILNHWVAVVVAVLVIVIVKAAAVWAILRRLGVSHGMAVATGLAVAQVGEFSFVLAEIARTGTHPLISIDTFHLAVSSMILTLFLTPFLVTSAPHVARLVERWCRPRLSRREQGPCDPDPGPLPSSCFIIGFGPAGQEVATALAHLQTTAITVIELNRRTAAAAQQLGLHTLIGDATHQDVLQHAGIARASVITVTVPDPAAARAIAHACRHLAPEAVVIARLRYHRRRLELELAGAHEIVDEEEFVGRRLAAMTLRRIRTDHRSPDSHPDDHSDRDDFSL